MLGFIIRTSRCLHNINSIRLIYISLVRSVLEYCSVVWSPTYEVHIAKLEKVQNKFIRYLSFKLHKPLSDHSYSEIRNELNLPRLSSRRMYADVLFLHKLLNSKINCNDLLSLIDFNVPSRVTRTSQNFAIKFHCCNFGRHSPLSRIILNGNRIDLDLLLCTSENVCRQCLKKICNLM
uniref:Uncharacterized protein LOC114328385 n=1 Tax=Diabrotica virgifera virgifera TaxID=50390 RepID=A0A6P7FIH9_DIAVI